MNPLERLIDRVAALEAAVRDLKRQELPVIYKIAGTPTNGVTLAGVAPTGALLVGGTKVYINTNTLESPTWTVVGTQS